MTAENPKIHAVYRYPVKGLSPELLERTTVAVQETCRPIASMPSKTGRPASTPPPPAISPSSAI
jgi:hypothetical protein